MDFTGCGLDGMNQKNKVLSSVSLRELTPISPWQNY